MIMFASACIPIGSKRSKVAIAWTDGETRIERREIREGYLAVVSPDGPGKTYMLRAEYWLVEHGEELLLSHVRESFDALKGWKDDRYYLKKCLGDAL